MDIPLFTQLLREGLIDEQEFNKIAAQKDKPVSVHWDLRTLLYLGIVLLTTAVGILIYKNIASIGHMAMLVILAVICIACFGYSIKNSKGYSNKKIESPNIWFDYVLLLGCLLLLTFTGYIQFQYNVFGNQWGLALFMPMVFLFIAAYYFDHLGVLSLAITNLAAWAGISVTPLRILNDNDFNNPHIIYAGLATGVLLLAASLMSKLKNIKAHFNFTYKNFGTHILFISLLALMFYFEPIFLVCFIVLAGVSYWYFKNAIKNSSFYFLVIAVLYFYVGLSYVVIKLLLLPGYDMGALYLGPIYFIFSGIGLIRLFIHYNKIFKKNAGLPG
ncbi:MAG: DUF2157 domain-containing protein [Ginsengibacter sp.]